jgi:hypothetical protein
MCVKTKAREQLFFLHAQARGVSIKILPNVTKVDPSQWPLGKMVGNTVHSNMVGLSFYKNGYRPPSGGVLRWEAFHKSARHFSRAFVSLQVNEGNLCLYRGIPLSNFCTTIGRGTMVQGQRRTFSQ